jgi:hypothetical protein
MDNFKPRVLRRAEMEKELEKLLNVEAEIRSDSYLLTFYFPMENMTRADAERHVKSFILEHLRKDEKLSGMGKINQRIVEAVLTGLGNTKELRRGLAIFVEFRMGEDVKADEVRYT